MARSGSAARGDPLYELGVVIGRLLRTVIYTGRVPGRLQVRKWLRPRSSYWIADGMPVTLCIIQLMDCEVSRAPNGSLSLYVR
jgi:hypothetical protein